MAVALVGIAVMVFLYMYQPPILSTDEAIIRAEEHLQHIPMEWERAFEENEFQDVPWGNFTAELGPRRGVWNTLLHRQQWEVTVNHNGKEPTVVIDAYTGKFLEMWGLLN
ncbi:PepSY domain-containing protein [Sporosarcina sp. NCCP-2716]|uniref:PepSY domain-containing protein n=1 Tax=Sporosarcina sp. NCCP-2716 TaxID=2943679 RepID=UPI00203F3878|nr:PepSY domain-containing protein [Sporosarcina sp. NCCP-2716]